MVTETPEDRRSSTLADWQAAIDDKDALLLDPETYTAHLIEQAMSANRQGAINADELRELLELVDAAYSWAVEEQLTRELNQ